MKKLLNTLLFVVALLFALQARAVYDPTIQQWIQRDPIGEMGGINLYQPMGNNPVNFADPSGLAVFGSFDANGNFNISYFPPGWGNPQPVLPGTLMPNQTAMGNMLNFPAGYDDFDYQFLNQMMRATDLYPYGNLSPSDIGQAYSRGYINGWDYPVIGNMTMKDATAQVLVAIAMEIPMGMPMPGRIPCPNGGANNVSRAARSIEEWLGPGYTRGRSDTSDLVLRSADGTRQIRFDLTDPHGLDPHVNVETWQPRNLYPGDRTFTPVDNIHVFPKTW